MSNFLLAERRETGTTVIDKNPFLASCRSEEGKENLARLDVEIESLRNHGEHWDIPDNISVRVERKRGE